MNCDHTDSKPSARDPMLGSPGARALVSRSTTSSKSGAINHPQRSPDQQKNYCCAAGGSMYANAERNESSEPLLSRLIAEIDLLEQEETAAYKQAWEIVPELVASESDPRRYLRVCGGDVREAATRLALYWKKRFALFGPDRAFLPMTQTGNGALSPDDLECLKTGTWTVLPKDREGRIVFLHDENLSTKQMERHEMRLPRFRCVFYVLNSIAADEASRSQGFLLLRKTDKPDFAKGRLANFFASLQAHAIHLSAYCLLCLPKSTGAKRMIQNTLIPAMKQTVPPPLRKRTHALVAGSVDELRNAIRRDAVLNGLDLRGLPPSLGGTWSYENFSHWQLQRLRFERDVHEPRFKKPPAKEPTTALPPPAAGTSDSQTVGLSVLANAVEAATARSDGMGIARLPTRKRPPPPRKPQEEEEQEATSNAPRRPKLDRRTMNMLYARRQRQREREMISSLRAKCRDLTRDNQRLQNECTMRETMLAAAKQLLEDIGREEEEKQEQAPEAVGPSAAAAAIPDAGKTSSGTKCTTGAIRAKTRKEHRPQAQHRAAAACATTARNVDSSAQELLIAGQPGQSERRSFILQSMNRTHHPEVFLAQRDLQGGQSGRSSSTSTQLPQAQLLRMQLLDAARRREQSIPVIPSLSSASAAEGQRQQLLARLGSGDRSNNSTAVGATAPRAEHPSSAICALQRLLAGQLLAEEAALERQQQQLLFRNSALAQQRGSTSGFSLLRRQRPPGNGDQQRLQLQLMGLLRQRQQQQRR